MSGSPSARDSFVTPTVDLADRSDADARGGVGILGSAIDSANAIVPMSQPLQEAVEITGLLSGHLELIANKQDFDFMITPYEPMPDGRYFQLPPFASRASHVGCGAKAGPR